MAKRAMSAGILMYRFAVDGGGLEVFLAHPGGPFWAHKDTGVWTIPKGLLDEGEDALMAARREFEEETGIRPTGPFILLGEVRQKAGKIVRAWACKGEADPTRVSSNTHRIEWPPGTGNFQDIPEIDRCAWFDPPTARQKLNPAQAEFIGRLEELLSKG